MMNLYKLKLNLLYKANRDGFKAIDFHSRCDNKGQTNCVIKSEHGKTFGGYTNLSWNKNDKYIAGKGKSFIFQLDENTKHNCIKKEYEIHGASGGLIWFGGGTSDIWINDSSD
jgi:hypothetical protein